MGRTRTRETDLGGNGLKGWQRRGGAHGSARSILNSGRDILLGNVHAGSPVDPRARCDAEVERTRASGFRTSARPKAQRAPACPSSGPAAPACRCSRVLEPLGDVPGMPQPGLDCCVALAGCARGAAQAMPARRRTPFPRTTRPRGARATGQGGQERRGDHVLAAADRLTMAGERTTEEADSELRVASDCQTRALLSCQGEPLSRFSSLYADYFVPRRHRLTVEPIATGYFTSSSSSPASDLSPVHRAVR